MGRSGGRTGGHSGWGSYPWPDRLLDRVIVWEDGCWTFDIGGLGGAPVTTGVPAVIRNEHGIQENAFRAIYRLLVGEPEHDLYAWCNLGRHCVNPGHKLDLTDRERARVVTWRNEGYDCEEQCAKGHPRAEFGYRNAAGGLKCRVCSVEDKRQWRERNQERQREYDRERYRLGLRGNGRTARHPLSRGGDQGRDPGTLPG